MEREIAGLLHPRSVFHLCFKTWEHKSSFPVKSRIVNHRRCVREGGKGGIGSFEGRLIGLGPWSINVTNAPTGAFFGNYITDRRDATDQPADKSTNRQT